MDQSSRSNNRRRSNRSAESNGRLSASNSRDDSESHHSNHHHDILLEDMSEESEGHRTKSRRRCNFMSSTRVMVLLILCLQNSLFTLLRRYSLGVRKENYSKYELLLVGEIIKLLFSAGMIRSSLPTDEKLRGRLIYLVQTSRKMVGLAVIYGAMNILSLVSLRNIGAGLFTIFAQCKILTTAVFSTLILSRRYTWTQWRALIGLSFGVLLFSEPIWGKSENRISANEDARPFVGTVAVMIEVSLSGFASIYFEKVIKTDPLQLSIWERNFQLALGSVPVYMAFILFEGGGTAGLAGGWSSLSFVVAMLGAAGGLLVALSIKYGDSILKTLATTGAIVLSSILDHYFMGGPLTPPMMIAAVQVILSICNYTFDMTPKETVVAETKVPSAPASGTSLQSQEEGKALIMGSKN